ncbi:MAG: helix-turn-helix transcriptional regulator [Lachnospiraceae bacterium]|nr:helix-turn-helix transcriptional regulator [Lachnospiraceae bacterium]
MNIEIANRLVNLRKSNNLSQEALAEKLGISRQAVSKWERAEASPDTDNLILLARLYGVSLDELLKTDDEIPRPEAEGASAYTESETWGEGSASGQNDDKEEYVHVGPGGVHVKDKNGEVHVGWDGIHVDDKKKGDNVHIDRKGVYVNGEKYDKEWISHHAHFPMFLIIMIAYLVIGCMWNAWHPGWLLFLLVPIWHSLVDAIEKKNASRFAYPVLATLIFLCLGIFYMAWHPGWVVFLTIPLYYSLVSYIQAVRGRHKTEKGNHGLQVDGHDQRNYGEGTDDVNEE